MNTLRNNTVLVTGGTGFVAVHVIFKLLQEGYVVRTTLRSLSRKEELIAALRSAGINDFDRLSFIEADLLKDENWDDAVDGADYVLHLASPFPGKEPKDENELIVPARDGALRVLKAARNAGVKRVVLTSSFAAIGYSVHEKGHVFTEEDWTDASAAIPAYIKSKTVAEKAAWEFVNTEGNGLEFVVINPVGIFGPVLGNILSASVDVVIKGIIEGTTTISPDLTLGVVDVRDVAGIHILAMTNAAASGQRFLAAADGVMSFYDVAQLIRKERPERASKIADINKTDDSFYIELSNNKAKTLLHWNPRSKEEAILASVDSLIQN
ncbi:SDR family oxidoreductase [Pinibacter aurantiacus]|uniref:Aldehyde reductase n=1 Tax=Pinibacter aurantiacus TaxID=2851599 RepID=A0A9E2S583_9BACT|nr:aldehyde reductase [Pinibacter aurantiacus]MBV4355857.1 aldehyde reductase [Pinibacter aurantiacus]